MNTWPNYITKLNLKIYNVSGIPFSSIIINECDSLFYYKCENTSKKLEFKMQNNAYETTIEKKHSLNSPRYLLLEIIPEYDIKYMVAETKISEYVQINTSTLTVIIIVVIILISLLIYIIYLFIKCIKTRSKDLLLTNLTPNKEIQLIPQN